MSQNTAQSQRLERRIALVRSGTAESAALQLVESMLWAFQGTMRSNWVAAQSADAADVVVIGNAAPAEQIAAWRKSGKPIIAVTAAGTTAPDAEHVLVYPFKATQLLQVLNALDLRLSNATAAAVTAATGTAPVTEAAASKPHAAAKSNPWSFVETLRTLRAVQNAEVWLTGMHGTLPVLWLKGDGTEYCADPVTQQDIRRGSFPFGAVQMRKGSAPPATRSVRPAAELEWFAGCHASTELAPWLKAETAYRITRWPNFGLIRPLPSQIRVTALLSSIALDLQQIVRRTQVRPVEAIRTLNALDASGLLVAMQAAPAKGSEAPKAPIQAEPPGGLAAFVRAVRKRLGMSEKS